MLDAFSRPKERHISVPDLFTFQDCSFILTSFFFSDNASRSSQVISVTFSIHFTALLS